jgi:hypothetical protein
VDGRVCQHIIGSSREHHGSGFVCNQVAVAADVCVAKGNARAAKALATIRALQSQYSLKSVIA